MNFLVRLCVFWVVSLGLVGCAQQGDGSGIRSRQEVRAPASAYLAFKAVANKKAALSQASPSDLSHLAIAKKSLDKEYLLTGSLIEQLGAPTGSGFRGRIVVFRRRGKSVFLMEATQGHVVTDDLPAALILAELPIIREDGKFLVIDFNAGMKKVFTSGAYYVSDFDGGQVDTSSVMNAVHVEHSYLDSVRVFKDRVEIRQIAQINDKFSQNFPTLEVRYIFRPYRPDPTFKPRKRSKFNWVGYFEVPPVYENGSGKSTVRVAKWHQDRKITFHMSRNTPQEYRNAVREGILYWNRAFGKNVLKAKLAPKGVTAPDANLNVVQWVPWDTAGFAYADFLMDPRSGEIRNAQVYMTSVFAFASKMRVRKLLRYLKNQKKTDHKKKHVGLSILQSGRICDHEMHAEFVEGLEKLLESDVPEETLLRVSQSYVRNVVAHEIGHTLGLRHNFAGSLGSMVTLDERDQMLNRYLLDGVSPSESEGVLASTVMDYLPFVDDILLGEQMQDSKEAYVYDRTAIRWGYFDEEVQPDQAPFFCTDSHVSRYVDCNRFDSGADVLVDIHTQIRSLIDRLPSDVLESYIDAKAPLYDEDKLSVAEVSLDPKTKVMAVQALLSELTTWLGRNERSLLIERNFSFVSSLNQEEIKDAFASMAHSQILGLGGVSNALFPFLIKTGSLDMPLAREWSKQLDKLLAKPSWVKGMSTAGKPFSLSKSEVQTIKQNANRYFEAVEEKLVRSTLETLSQARFENPYLAAEIEENLGRIAEAIILKSSSKDLTESFYPLETRIAAAKALSNDLSQAYLDWSMDARAKVTKKLRKRASQVVQQEIDSGFELEKGEVSDLSKGVRTWYLEQKQIYDLLLDD